MSALESGVDSLAFSSGMAAIDAVMRLFVSGDHILTGFDLYGGSFRLFRSVYEPYGLTFSAVHTSDLEAVERAITPKTKAIYLETPTNPTMEITDLRALAELAHKKGLLVIVDNTFLTPYFQRPLELGCDIVLHSGTKYLAGHNDILAGFVISREKSIAEKLRSIYKTTGACLSVLTPGSCCAASAPSPCVCASTKKCRNAGCFPKDPALCAKGPLSRPSRTSGV